MADFPRIFQVKPEVVEIAQRFYRPAGLPNARFRFHGRGNDDPVYFSYEGRSWLVRDESLRVALINAYHNDLY